MTKPTQLQRVKEILSLLLLNGESISSLKNKLKENNDIDISERQLYRDLKDLEKFFLRDGEKLTVKTEGNKKIWELVKNMDAERIKDFDIKTFLLSKITSPACLDGRKSSFNNIYGLLKDNLNNSNFKRYVGIEKNLANTHFYEVYKKMEYQEHLDDLIWICSTSYKINITTYQGDAVSKYKSLSPPFDFIPLKTIYHRGSFFIGGILDNEEKQILVLDVNQIINFDTIDFNRSKKPLLKKLNIELEKRFGITQNMDDKIYTIELEFSSTTGLYVKEHRWHKSEKFEELPNGNHKMILKCGINRELVGWIFQWMGNVKILNPPELKDLYKAQLEKMTQLQKGEQLVYSNIFQPE